MTREQLEKSIVNHPGDNYYQILGLHPSASNLDIRRQYRELSKRFHPDTTTLPQAIAKSKFQELNQAYATLSNPDRRSLYDLQIGYSRLNVIQAPPSYNQNNHSVYTGPSDRPLSAGEVFALFLLVLTFVGCLLLALIVAMVRG